MLILRFYIGQLLHQIRVNINAINTHIDNNFENSLSKYRSLSSTYIDELNSLDDYRKNLMTSNLTDSQHSILTENINKLRIS